MADEIWLSGKDDEVWVLAVCAELVDDLPVIAIVKEGTKAECEAMKARFEENPDQVRIKGDPSKVKAIKFVITPESLLGDDWRDDAVPGDDPKAN